MQPRTAPPRDQYTSDQITALIQDWPGVHSVYGCELLNMNLEVLADISDSLIAGSVARGSYNTLHGESSTLLDVELEWGVAIVRPYVTMSMPGVDARFNLGAYFTSTPKYNYAQNPVTFDVKGYDILDALNDPVGESYAVRNGVQYLSAVEDILQQRGYTQYEIDKQYWATGDPLEKKLPFSRSWPLAENATWLKIVNDLLGAIGYQGIWSDWDGALRVGRYRSPSTLPSEWTYEEGGIKAMLAQLREVEKDFYRAPNRWVFYQTNTSDEGPPPQEGSGIYTVVNESDGPTSIEGRGGRVFTKPVPLDVADHASLVDAAQITVDADKRIKTTLAHSGWPNPLHWHFDRVTLIDPDLGSTVDALVTAWSMPFDGSDMSHEWTLFV